MVCFYYLCFYEVFLSNLIFVFSVVGKVLVKLYENKAETGNIVTFKESAEYPDNPIQTGRQDDFMSLGLKIKDGAAVSYQGLFKPPTTGRYKFRVFCDRKCEFYLSSDHRKSQKIEILKLPYPSDFFDLEYPLLQETPESAELIEGDEYYIELFVLSLPDNNNHGEVKFFHPDVQKWYPMIGQFLGTYTEN
eukprot:TCONS_00002262-protein